MLVFTPMPIASLLQDGVGEVFNAVVLAGFLYQLVVPLYAKILEICIAAMPGVEINKEQEIFD